MKKITKRERFESIVALCEAAPIEGFDYAGIAEFCEKEIDALDRKAVKAKERAAEKRAEGDELTERVFSFVTEDPATIDDIVAFIDDEDVTKGKVQYRLGQLYKAGRVEKVQVSVEVEGGKNRKLVAYCLPGGAIEE